jgi:hypothetical protein
VLLGQRLPGASGGYVNPQALVESLRVWTERPEAHILHQAGPRMLARRDRFEAHHNRFNPVLEYHEGLTWDDVPRLDRWLQEYLGAEDTHTPRRSGG